MPTPRALYITALDDISKRFGRLDDQTIRRLIGLLQESRKAIGVQLAGTQTEFQLNRLRQLQASMDQIVNDFQSQLTVAMRQSLGNAHQLGPLAAIEPLEAIGINVAFNALAPSQVNAVLDFSAVLVKDIGDDLRSTINTQLRLAGLGQQSPFNTMKAITDAMGIKARDGVWGRRRRPETVRGVAARAETIVRTEMTRVFNLGHQSQQTAIAETVPGLRKRWVATADRRTRASHLATHRRTFSDPIPIKQPFRVGRAKLMFPGDPRGPASETINCRCRVVTVHPDVGVVGTPLDKKIDVEVEKRGAKAKAKSTKED